MGQLEALMKLGLSEAEAQQVLEDDKKIDRGEKMSFDISKTQEKETRNIVKLTESPLCIIGKSVSASPTKPSVK